MNKLILSLCFIFLEVSCLYAQVDFNANTHTNSYSGHFNYGVNMGYYPPWTDAQLADIAAGNPSINLEGAGVNSLRPALYEHFLERWGYDIRVGTFQHYTDLGIKNNTAFIGYPSKDHQDSKEFCLGVQSKMFANMYLPIWDGGKNGTPVNEDNHYANYVYKMVQRYGAHVKFWEVWNEPDYTSSGNGDKAKGSPGNWWDEDPNPCDLKNLQAPIQYYIRALRITYEIVKHFDPTDFICLGGIGYASFVDAILRNTDNPDQGKVTGEFPHKGGAWFDCVSYHNYPMYYLRNWDNSIGGFKYHRHSDAAVDAVIGRRHGLNDLLKEYGYDGKKYPEKTYIITESNIPRLQTSGQEYIGSDEAQRNFAIKALVQCQKNRIDAFYLFSFAETVNSTTYISNPYAAMGMFRILKDAKPYTFSKYNVAHAYKTTSGFLAERKFSATQTAALKLPIGIEGAAFYHEMENDFMYVLWAKTGVDKSEKASKNYTFPVSWEVQSMEVMEWDYSVTNAVNIINSNQISLKGSPVFIKLSSERVTGLGGIEDKNEMSIYPNPAVNNRFYVKIENLQNKMPEFRLYSVDGKEVYDLKISKIDFDTFEINLNSTNSKGLFIFTAFDDKNRVQQKVVIE